MKLCQKTGNGVCIGCDRFEINRMGYFCRYDVEEAMDLLAALLETELTDEQKDVLEDFRGG